MYHYHRVALGLETLSDSSNTIPTGESSVGEVQPVDAISATHFDRDDDATSVHEGRHEVAPVGVKYIFLFQSNTGCTRLPNHFDTLNVHIEWS